MTPGARAVRIVVLCPYPRDRAPSQRLKFEQYYDDWEAHGYEVDVRPFWDEEAWEFLYRPGRWRAKVGALVRGLRRRRADLRAALAADLVYLHLEAAPVGPPTLERRLDAAGIPLVYDIDDLVHLPHASRANAFVRFLRGGDKVPELMARADHVVTCTRYLEEMARQHNDRVTNISSTIDTDAYQPRADGDHTDGVVVGWSGSHSTSPYLHLLDDVLRELVRTEGVRLRVIGDGGWALEGVPGDAVRATEWRLATEVEDLSEIDVGVYPLPDREWVLGKSGLKALQYMALEIPTVAQRVGANLEIVRDGENGFLAGGGEEWLERLRALVRDPGLRRRMGRAGRRTVVERYSVEANRSAYRRVLEEARK